MILRVGQRVEFAVGARPPWCKTGVIIELFETENDFGFNCRVLYESAFHDGRKLTGTTNTSMLRPIIPEGASPSIYSFQELMLWVKQVGA